MAGRPASSKPDSGWVFAGLWPEKNSALRWSVRSHLYHLRTWPDC